MDLLASRHQKTFYKGTEYYGSLFDRYPGNLFKKKKSTNILMRQMTVELPGQQKH